jgi:hypothetical protein
MGEAGASLYSPQVAADDLRLARGFRCLYGCPACLVRWLYGTAAA